MGEGRLPAGEMLSLRVVGKTSGKDLSGMWREWRSSRGRSGLAKAQERRTFPGGYLGNVEGLG